MIPSTVECVSYQAMASGEASAITTQPKSRRKEVEEFVRDLDPLQVVGEFYFMIWINILLNSVCVFTEWSEQEVVDKYLKPIDMDHLAKVFVENKINGAVLLGLEVRLLFHVFRTL